MPTGTPRARRKRKRRMLPAKSQERARTGKIGTEVVAAARTEEIGTEAAAAARTEVVAVAKTEREGGKIERPWPSPTSVEM